MKSVGFFSYVHKDDEAERGRITNLVNDITDQYEMLTGEQLTLFLDNKDINWGEKWREKIDSALESVVFFIPVITPRYFQSAECRGELQYFYQKAERFGLRELILPLLYVDFNELHDESITDDLIQLIKSLEWIDWSEVKYADETSEIYRRAIAKIVAQLIEKNQRIESNTNTHEKVSTVNICEETQDEPGTLDYLAETEQVFPKISMTIQDLSTQMQIITSFTQKANKDAQLPHNQVGFAPRLIIINQLSKEISEPVNKIWQICNDYVSQLHKIDLGIQIFINQVTQEIKSNPEGKDNLCFFFYSVRTLDSSTSQALESFKELSKSADGIASLSRVIRPLMRRLNQGLSLMNESKEIIYNWVQMIDATGIVCDEINE